MPVKCTSIHDISTTAENLAANILLAAWSLAWLAKNSPSLHVTRNRRVSSGSQRRTNDTSWSIENSARVPTVRATFLAIHAIRIRPNDGATQIRSGGFTARRGTTQQRAIARKITRQNYCPSVLHLTCSSDRWTDAERDLLSVDWEPDSPASSAGFLSAVVSDADRRSTGSRWDVFNASSRM